MRLVPSSVVDLVYKMGSPSTTMAPVVWVGREGGSGIPTIPDPDQILASLLSL